MMLLHERRLIFDNNGRDTLVRAAIAIDRKELAALTIVNDVHDHYHEKLSLGSSRLGGLKVSFEIPMADAPG